MVHFLADISCPVYIASEWSVSNGLEEPFLVHLNHIESDSSYYSQNETMHFSVYVVESTEND